MSKSVIEIVPALSSDSDDLQKLLLQLGYELSIDQISAKMSLYINKDLYSIFVAKEDGIILGFITLNCYDSFVFEGRCLHIESLIVSEQSRKKGIGKKLINAAEEYAKANNCTFSELVTLSKRKVEGAHAFYAALGYKDHQEEGITYFSKDLK